MSKKSITYNAKVAEQAFRKRKLYDDERNTTKMRIVTGNNFKPSLLRQPSPFFKNFGSNRKKKFCKFCKNNGENDYLSHRLRDNNGRVTCPILFKYKCPICNATGPGHTKNYCPQVQIETRKRIPVIGGPSMQSKSQLERPKAVPQQNLAKMSLEDKFHKQDRFKNQENSSFSYSPYKGYSTSTPMPSELTNDTIFKKELKTEALDMKIKPERKDEIEINAGLSVLETMDESVFKTEAIKSEHFDVKPKIEFKENLVFQDGLIVLDKLNDTIFEKGPKTEALDVKIKIEPKNELEMNAGLSVLKEMDEKYDPFPKNSASSQEMQGLTVKTNDLSLENVSTKTEVKVNESNVSQGVTRYRHPHHGYVGRK